MADAIVILRGALMRGRRETKSDEFPLYPISPILVSYGGQPVAEGLGWKSYRCPFHGDRDASGSVNTEKQVFNCHAADCPKGNAVQVIMQWEQVTFGEAKQRAITIAGQVDSSASPTKRREGGSRSGRDGGRGETRFRRTWR